MTALRYQVRPLGPWTGPVTPARERRHPQFRATYPATLELLSQEARLLGARELVLQADLAERDIRTDGLPRANARYGDCPGVIVSFGSRHGPLRYAADTYTSWQANLRAVALALEALRALDRYGVSRRGEQYTGWRALPAGNGSHFATADEALAWMRSHYAADRGHDLADVAQLPVKELARQLAKMLHPDAGGTGADWHRLDAARRLLTAAGVL